jgi:DNA polymerase III alpha subunit
MTHNLYGEIVFSSNDICDAVMSGRSIDQLQNLLVDQSVDLDQLQNLLEHADAVSTWQHVLDRGLTVEQFDQQQQSTWHMPKEYHSMDIAEHILNLCTTPEQLQRAGAELLLYQDRNLFDLLKYLKYLVDVMQDNNIIWGVGRGSSVASYVLYLLGVHRIDSMFYDLDPHEFLR